MYKNSYQFKAGHARGLTVRSELVEGWTVKPFMVRFTHHERLNLKLYYLKLIAYKSYVFYNNLQHNPHSI